MQSNKAIAQCNYKYTVLDIDNVDMSDNHYFYSLFNFILVLILMQIKHVKFEVPSSMISRVRLLVKKLADWQDFWQNRQRY